MKKDNDNAFRVNYTPENDNDSASWGGLRFADAKYKNKPFGMFGPYYKEHIRPFCQSFNLKRIKAKRTTTFRSIIAILPIIIIIYFAIIPIATVIFVDYKNYTESQMDLFVFISVFPFIAIGCIVYWVINEADKYKKNVKDKIYPIIFRFFGSDFRYKDMAELKISDHKILPKHDFSTFKNYVRGIYKGVTLEYVHNAIFSNDNSLLYTNEDSLLDNTFSLKMNLYKGIFIILTMNKKFSGETIVKKDNGLLGRRLSRIYIKKIEGLKNVKLEDPIFEKKFEIYSSDQQEARYLLTTSFMERLLELTELFPSKKIFSARVILYSTLVLFVLWIIHPMMLIFGSVVIVWYICVRILKSQRQGGIGGGVQCSFRDNKLLLMIPCYKKPFVTSIFKPATFLDDINYILKEMAIIFEIIDILKLERKTGL